MGQKYSYQKYTTNGKTGLAPSTSGQDCRVPWEMWYHFLMIGDGAFLTND